MTNLLKRIEFSGTFILAPVADFVYAPRRVSAGAAALEVIGVV